MALVEKGQLSEGLALIDEAAVAAVSGFVGPLWLTSFVTVFYLSRSLLGQEHRRVPVWARATW